MAAGSERTSLLKKIILTGKEIRFSCLYLSFSYICGSF
jgi:hypothetical protein